MFLYKLLNSVEIELFKGNVFFDIILQYLVKLCKCNILLLILRCWIDHKCSKNVAIQSKILST